MCRAIDLLILIQTEASKVVPPDTDAARLAFDKEKLSWELAFFRRYYGNYRQLPLPEDQGLIEECNRLAEELASYPRFLCHRDYHVRNLMVKDEEVHIIDFQDARQGPALYDLVSLLKDSIQLTPEEVEWYIGYYVNQSKSAYSPALLEDESPSETVRSDDRPTAAESARHIRLPDYGTGKLHLRAIRGRFSSPGLASLAVPSGIPLYSIPC